MARETWVQSQVESYQRLKKMVLDASLLNTQHYKVRIKGKVEQSREGVAPSPTPWCSSYRKGSLRVTLDYGRQLKGFTGSLAQWVECLPMIRKTWVQSQVASYQRLLKWYLIPPSLTLSNIRYLSRVKWSNSGKGVAPFPTPQCSSY